MQNLYAFLKARAVLYSAQIIRSKSLMLLMAFVFLSVQQSFGQALVENAMNSIKSWIVIILNVAFLIGIAIGIFKAAMKFFTGAPDKVEFMIGIVIAIALFGGFQFIVDDLAAFLGGDILLDDTQG
ncbi:hypothetical protein WJR50_29205 [Catalinimonas sp. 4WD22]|uniref:hypothetical protein n=1 Tax=Catalinimonas locisalis TaxID=3133978 RepID=UPI0031010FA1